MVDYLLYKNTISGCFFSLPAFPLGSFIYILGLISHMCTSSIPISRSEGNPLSLRLKPMISSLSISPWISHKDLKFPMSQAHDLSAAIHLFAFPCSVTRNISLLITRSRNISIILTPSKFRMSATNHTLVLLPYHYLPIHRLPPTPWALLQPQRCSCSSPGSFQQSQGLPTCILFYSNLLSARQPRVLYHNNITPVSTILPVL